MSDYFRMMMMVIIIMMKIITKIIYNKEIKNAPSAMLSYISTQEFLRTREKCGEARAEGSEKVFYFFNKINVVAIFDV